MMRSHSDDHDFVIADFGLARFLQNGERLYCQCGTPGYVAPEILGDSGYGCKSDMFAAGVIM